MALAARVHEEILQAPRRMRGGRLRRVRVRGAGRGLRVALTLAVPLALVLLYVWLTAELTAQTYRLHEDQARQAALQQKDTELRQQVARLESLPRLEAVAAKLHMTAPSQVAVVTPAAHAAPPEPMETAIAASLADVRKWFGIR